MQLLDPKELPYISGGIEGTEEEVYFIRLLTFGAIGACLGWTPGLWFEGGHDFAIIGAMGGFVIAALIF